MQVEPRLVYEVGAYILGEERSCEGRGYWGWHVVGVTGAWGGGRVVDRVIKWWKRKCGGSRGIVRVGVGIVHVQM